MQAKASDSSTFELEEIRAETNEAFYASIGQRLTVLASLPRESRPEFISGLLEQCFRLGPNGLDAGIFVLASEAKAAFEMESDLAKNYRQRLDKTRELRLSLLPMFERLRAINLD